MDESRSSRSAADALLELVRKWPIIVPFLIVTPLVVVAISASQPRAYAASADVLVNRQGFSMSGLRDPTFWYPNRALLTQARLARLPEVAQRVVDAAGLADRGRYGFLGQSSVTTIPFNDVMSFHATDSDPELAARLATTYAEQYIAFRNELDTRSLSRARAVVERQLALARALGDPDAYADLMEKQQQLDTALASISTNATLVSPAAGATQIAPRALESLYAALFLGLVVGVGLAGLAILLDPRSRSPEEISEQVGAAVVSLLPRERSPRLSASALADLRRGGRKTEAIHALRASLELASPEPSGRIVLVTSAVAAEGKSTTAAELAVAYAHAGRIVSVVDLDLRRPTLARRFGVPAAPGIADVLRGDAMLDEAAHGVLLGGELARAERSPVDPARGGGALRVVPAGDRRPADLVEIASGHALEQALEALRASSDLVLVDSPPLLQSSDPLALSRYADDILLVIDARRYRRRYGPELRHLLALSPARPLGIVVISEPAWLGPARGHSRAEPSSLTRHLQTLGRA